MTHPRRASSGAAAATLAVTRLSLTRFRSYGSLRLDADPRPVVLTGPNGAGKTNLLEAVSLLVPGRGLRRARLSDMRQLAAPDGAGWAVAASALGAHGPVEIGTGQEGSAAAPAAETKDRRVVRIDNHTARGQTALSEHLAMVWLTPQMDRLFQEGASARRRFLDRIVFGFDPAHAGRLTRYDAAMRARSRLLQDGRADPVWLSSLESQMVETGMAITAARVEVVHRLVRAVARTGAGTRPDDSVFPEPLVAVGGPVERLLSGRSALAAEDLLREALVRDRRADAQSGTTATGPHRSDLEVRHRAKDMPAALCSTGEQKALLIALVLATARVMAADRGMVPILLLDEVAAHLDETRRAALFETVIGLGAQVWFTGTDASVFAPLDTRAQHWRVADAQLRASTP